ncbi:putative ribonuclease H domain-containing protein [Arabidopsis thaliana]
MAKEWNSAQLKDPNKQEGSRNPPIHTIGADTIQVFSDAAWKKETSEAGFGWLFIDPLSKSEKRYRSTASNVSSPLMAEAMALLLAIHQALDLGYKNLSFASDSQQLIKALTREPQSKELYRILHDILDLSLNFSTVNFFFVRRENSRVADELAKAALSSFSCISVI